MNLLIPILILAAIGLIAGLGLAIASKILAVPVNGKEQQIREVLPGANCGACGFSGCDGYAKALADGTAESTALCSPGGAKTAESIAAILGVAGDSLVRRAAVVHCRGCHENTGIKMNYSGVQTCRTASQLYGGPGACSYGCIGLGDCVAVCEYGALQIREGVAAVDPALCTACGKCIRTCPKGLIDLLPAETPKAAVLCSSKAKGAQTRKDCKAGCIGCKKCEKVCPSDAVVVTANLAHINPDKCTACGACVENCPQHCIELFHVTD